VNTNTAKKSQNYVGNAVFYSSGAGFVSITKGDEGIATITFKSLGNTADSGNITFSYTIN
jgi:hypothetical protein